VHGLARSRRPKWAVGVVNTTGERSDPAKGRAVGNTSILRHSDQVTYIDHRPPLGSELNDSLVCLPASKRRKPLVWRTPPVFSVCIVMTTRIIDFEGCFPFE
jgi:hypothetical protein